MSREASGRPQPSKLIRFADFRWEGIRPVAYKEPDAGWAAVTRHLLVGRKEATPFHLRYFEIGPGGFTTLERHGHQHVVVALRGQGEVCMGDRWEPVAFGDVVYVAPNDPHQFRATGDEPFGFLCMVNAERDRPVPP